jgi:hypothetical protein
LSGGIRFDQFKNSFPPQSIAPTALAPNLNVSYDRIQNLNWKDVTPKLGATYDVFGTGRTALKVTLNKYLAGLGTTGSLSDPPNPINRLVTTTTRPWNDSFYPAGDPRRQNFRPDCDLLNSQVNGECGLLQNAATFGTVLPGTTYDPDLLVGWGKRDFNWEFTTSVQHEVVPRLSVEVQYARRWYGNFRVQDDRLVGPGDYDRFTLNTPSDPRLPDGGSYQLTGYDLKPTASTTQNNFVTLASNFGNQTEHFDGVNISVNARLQNGLVVQGGAGLGRVITDDCEIVEQLPETLHQFLGNNTRSFVFTARPLERCREERGMRTRIQGLASYTIPKIDVQVAGTFQNLPGVGVNANANVAPASTNLGRPFSSGPFRSFNIVESGELFVERLNQLDFRVSKIVRFGETRTSVNFDLYNIFNANSVIAENATYTAPPSTTWRTPTTILLPRLFKFSVQLDF